jgi:hypothetical protein
VIIIVHVKDCSIGINYWYWIKEMRRESKGERENKQKYKQSYILGHNAVYSVESQPTFHRKTSPGNLLPVSRRFLAWLIFRLWRWRRNIPPKRPLTFNRPHDAISQKIGLFLTTVVRTWNTKIIERKMKLK